MSSKTSAMRAFAAAGMLFVVGAGQSYAAGKVTTVPVPDGGQAATAHTDERGTIHLVFNSSEGPKYVRSSDNGKTFSEPIAIVDRESQKPGLQYSIWDMAVSPGGYVHVALGTNAWKLKLPEEEWGFFYTSLEPGASAFSPVRNINRKPSEGFSLAADDKGRVTASWLSGKLYANVSRDNGKSFGPNVEIDQSFNPCDCCTTSAAYGADGKLALLYREETDNARDMYVVLWDQERNTSTRTRVSDTLWTIAGCPMSYYSIVRDRDGYVAIWPTKGDIYFARLDGKGKPVSPVEIKTPGTTGMRNGMVALPAPDGGTLLAWKKAGQLSWQFYDRQGLPSGQVATAESAGDGVAAVVTKSGEFVVFP